MRPQLRGRRVDGRRCRVSQPKPAHTHRCPRGCPRPRKLAAYTGPSQPRARLWASAANTASPAVCGAGARRRAQPPPHPPSTPHGPLLRSRSGRRSAAPAASRRPCRHGTARPICGGEEGEGEGSRLAEGLASVSSTLTHKPRVTLTMQGAASRSRGGAARLWSRVMRSPSGAVSRRPICSAVFCAGKGAGKIERNGSGEVISAR